MHDAEPVRRLERLADAAGHLDGNVCVDGTFANPAFERDAFGVFHDEVGLTARQPTPVEHGDDAGVLERGQRPRLPQQPLHSLLITATLGAQGLEGEAAP